MKVIVFKLSARLVAVQVKNRGTPFLLLKVDVSILYQVPLYFLLSFLVYLVNECNKH